MSMQPERAGSGAVSGGGGRAFDAARFARGVADASLVALERAKVGVVIIDADLRFVFVNDVAAAINGHSAADHIGRSISDILTGTAESITPMLRDVMRTGVAVHAEEVVGETRARPGELRVWSGDYLPYQLDGDSAPDDDQAANSVLVVFSEVTDERRAERQLRQVIDGLFTFVGLCDIDGTLREANEFALAAAGIDLDDVVGRPFWDCYWWSYDTEVQVDIRRAVERAATGVVCRFDTFVRIAGGRVIPIDFQLVPVVEHGRVISLVPSGIDIEARSNQIRNLAELTALAADLHVALGMRELVELVVGRSSGLFGTSLVTFGVVDAVDGSMRVTSPAELDRAIADRWSLLAGDGPRTPFHDVATTGEAVWLFDCDERRRRYPEMADDSDRAGLVSTAALALTDSTGVIGVLGLGWSDQIADDPALRLHAVLFSNICSQALVRVNRMRTTVDLVTQLSSELMARRDYIEHLDVAVGYVPAVSQIGFGGDWYDVVSMGESTTALIVGDVVGHNVEAAARMAITRSALRTAVLALPNLVGVGDLVTRSLGLRRREFFATALVVIVDTERNKITWKSFGHVPAVLCAPDGTLTLLADAGPPIGLVADTAPIGSVSFTPGSTLVLYTDGLVETRSDPIDDRIALLARTIADAPAASRPTEVLALVMETLVPDDLDDDVAAVVAVLPG